jgi:flagellar basal body P-ring formation protein FlgA
MKGAICAAFLALTGLLSISEPSFLHGQPSEKALATIRPDAQRTIWTLARSMKSGEVIQEDDMAAQLRDRRNIPPGAITDPEEIIGMQAVRTIQAGVVLVRDQWKTVAIVKKGQRVQIVLDTPTLRIVAPGESLQDGGEGDKIRVLNVGSRQVIVARVRDGQTVRVEF